MHAVQKPKELRRPFPDYRRNQKSRCGVEGSSNTFNYFMLVSKSINIRKEPTKKQNSLCKNSEGTVFIINI